MTSLDAVVQVLSSGLTDGQLLERFIVRREEAAFATLVRRHGPMVLGVCRRILGSVHDADDAFQATFLVLVRRAEAVVPREQVGVWLHGVAYRIALKARSMAARRRRKERCAARSERVEAPTPDDLRVLLDRELVRLPDKYRTPLILCELEGRSRREAARQLGLPEGTLSSRLATARTMLARRLTRDSLVVSAVPVALTASTVRAAARVAIGEASGLSDSVVALTEGVFQTMKPTYWQMAVAVLMFAAVGGAGLLTRQVFAGDKADKVPTATSEIKDKKEVGPSVRGTAREVNAAKKTIVISVVGDAGTKKVVEKSYPLAENVRILLGDNLTKDKPIPEGKLDDVTPGTGVDAQLSLDGKTVVQILARGPALLGSIKAVDATKNTITLIGKGEKGEKGSTETTLALPEGVLATLSDGLSKEDKPQTKKPTELEEGTRVVVQLSVDRKSALALRVQNESLRGTLKGIDNGANTVTVEVKEDGGLVEKLLTLSKDAKVEGNPTAGDPVIVQLSVFDKKTAIRVHVP